MACELAVPSRKGAEFAALVESMKTRPPVSHAVGPSNEAPAFNEPYSKRVPLPPDRPAPDRANGPTLPGSTFRVITLATGCAFGFEGLGPKRESGREFP
jgi:hypothetical protein